MPDLFLSPSLQPFNLYVNGGNEAQIMGYLADALEPYLRANNISFVRSNPQGTLGDAIRLSNSQNFRLHLALHSNASPESSPGRFQGIQGYYYPTSAQGKRAAQDLVDSLKLIYPQPENVYIVPTTTIAEVRRTKAPAVLMEIGYHDNLEDANWIKNNIQNIARSLAVGLCEFFGKPFIDVCIASGGAIGQGDIGSYVINCTRDSSPLNIRTRPDLNSNVVTQLPPRQKAILLNIEANSWALIRYNDKQGYAASQFLCSCTNTRKKEGVVNTNGSNLNIRRAPNTSAAIIGRIPDKTRIEILQTQGNWYQVNYNGITGYVLAQFVKVT